MSKPEGSTDPVADVGADPPAVRPEESSIAASINLSTAPLLMDVKLPIRILMGRAQLCLRDITQLSTGSVVELDCSPNDAVEIVVNGRSIAQGEIVVVAGNYGVRITQIAGQAEASKEQPADSLRNLSERLK